MNRLPRSYFDNVYRDDPDPWGFESRWYEKRKYALTLAALPRERYGRGFEPGCSNGALTRLLARRCEQLVAFEIVPAAVARARRAVRDLPQVEVHELAIPEAWPTGEFDLIVLSEVAYYLADQGFEHMIQSIDQTLVPSGQLVAVHWTGETDYPLSGEAVHARLDGHAGLRSIARYQEPSFLLGVYERAAV